MCVLARAQALFSPASFHGIGAWFKLREARGKHEKWYGGRSLPSLPPYVGYYTLAGSSSRAATGDIGFRSCLHRIKGAGELYNLLNYNFGAEIAFWVHLNLHFGVRVRLHALSIIVQILQNSGF